MTQLANEQLLLVCATDIDISAAADFLQTDINTHTEIPGKNTTLAWIKFPGSVASYNTRPGNEVGLFYNAPEPTQLIICIMLSDVHNSNT